MIRVSERQNLTLILMRLMRQKKSAVAVVANPPAVARAHQPLSKHFRWLS
jgi:hypothetical protein